MAPSFTRRDFARAGLAAAASAALPLRSAFAALPAFHLGLVTYNVAKDWSLDTLLRLCREAGFEGVELRTTHAHGVERTLAPGARAEVRAKCRDAGLRQTSLGSVCEFHSSEPAVVRRNVADCRQWVLLARDIGARAVKVRPNGLPKDVPEEKTLEQIGRALAECGAFARDHGVEIWCEVHGEATRVPQRMRRIMDECSHPAVGVTWNSNDTDVTNGSVAESFELLRPFIRCCHITDIGVAPPPAPAGTSPGPSAPPAMPRPAPYPYRELFGRLSGAGFTGFTLCEYPMAVPAAVGADWLGRYRERWRELCAPLA
jgi:sugar phosphate isomerase/epimerase